MILSKKMIEETKTKRKSILELDIDISRISLEQKIVFAKNLSVMLKSGLTIVDGLEILKEQFTGRFKKLLEEISFSVRSGSSLAEALSRYPKVFSEMFINVIGAGEIAGTFEESMANVAEQLEKEKDLKSKIKGAMFYPVLILVAAFLMGVTISFLVLPKITPLFEGLNVELPFTTKALIWFSNLVRDNGLVLFSSLIAFVIAFFYIIKQKFSYPVTHFVMLKIPIIGSIIKQSNLIRFFRVLGTMLKSGLNIDEALEIAGKTISNYYYRKSIVTINKSITKGAKLSVLLGDNKKLYSLMSVRMIKVGEETGHLEETLLYLADSYEKEVDTATKTLSTVIEPVLLLFIGLVVAFLALSIITPIYEITGNIQR